MATNLPQRMTHEHVSLLSASFEAFFKKMLDAATTPTIVGHEPGIVYAREVVEFEIALILARKAAQYGIDLLNIGHVTRSQGPKNGVGSP